MDKFAPTLSTEAVPFASRAMMDILVSGLKIHQLSHAGVSFSPNMAKVPLSTKREFLTQVAEQHGIEVIPKLGRGAALHLKEPVGRALISSNSTVAKLCSRWQRLERYVHANHFTEIELGEQHIVVRHLSRTGESPSLLEDLAVLGLMCALIAQLNVSDVELYIGANFEHLVYQYTGNQVNQSALTEASEWKISWQAINQPGDTPEQQLDSSMSWEMKTRQSIEAIGLLDCSLENVASSQFVSTRTLQRNLASEGIKFAHLVQESRVNQASKLILENSSCLAEVGFLCGFSDQAHFTRVFTQWNGMSPKVYQSVGG